MSKVRIGKYGYIIPITFILEIILMYVYLPHHVRLYTIPLLRDLSGVETSILFVWLDRKGRDYTSTDDNLQNRKRGFNKYLNPFISMLIIFSALLVIDSIELYHLSDNSFLDIIQGILILLMVATAIWFDKWRKRILKRKNLK